MTPPEEDMEWRAASEVTLTLEQGRHGHQRDFLWIYRYSRMICNIGSMTLTHVEL